MPRNSPGIKILTRGREVARTKGGHNDRARRREEGTREESGIGSVTGRHKVSFVPIKTSGTEYARVDIKKKGKGQHEGERSRR